MKLILSSAGLTNQSIANALAKLLGKDPKQTSFLVIPTAHGEQVDSKFWFFDEIDQVRKYFSSDIDIAYLRATAADTLKAKVDRVDVVYFTGGDEDYLMKSINDMGLADYFRQLAQTKVMIGSSAGAQILSQRRPNEADAFLNHGKGKDEYYIEEGGKMLDLVDFGIIPHCGQHHLSDRPFSLAESSMSLFDHKAYALDDQSAVVVDGDDIHVVSEGEYRELDPNE